VQLLHSAPERENARSISSFSGGPEYDRVHADAVEKARIHQTLVDQAAILI